MLSRQLRSDHPVKRIAVRKMLDPEPSHLLCHDVEFVGLAARADLNGQQGVTFSFDAAKDRYGVLVKGERVSVKSNNLRLYEHPPLTDVALRRAREDPFTYYIVSPKIGCQMRHCANFKCGALGIVMGASSLKEAHKLSYKLLQTCSTCHEAVYCSTGCQTTIGNFTNLCAMPAKTCIKSISFSPKIRRSMVSSVVVQTRMQMECIRGA